MNTHMTRALCGVSLLIAVPAVAQDFSYNPPGQLKSGSGTGRVDDNVYVPGMRYPIEDAPSYPNSQVWGKGGLNGGGGGQCDAENYSYPWWDNYCETRSWSVPLCPGGKGHQGQDIRPATCTKDVHWSVAAEAGSITNIGSYTVTLVSDSGTKHRYLHMEPSSLLVSVGDTVTKGERLGRVSNAFGNTATTIHLHYDLFQTVDGVGPSYVPTYMSLIRSYEELIGMPAEPCGIISPTGGIVDDKDKCFSLAGNIRFWREVDGAGYNDRLYWTYAFTSANPGAWAQWNLEFAEAGTYRIEAFLTSEEATSRRARYVLRHNGSMQEIVVDLSADNNGWRTLGEYDFSAEGGQSLSLYDNTGEESDQQLKLPADAIRLTRIDGVMPPDMGTADMGTIDPPDMPAAQDMSAPVDQGSVTPVVDMGTVTPLPDMTVATPDMGSDGGGAAGGSAKTSSCDEGCSTLPSGEPRWPVEFLLLGALGLFRIRRNGVKG